MNYYIYLWNLYGPGICALWLEGRRLIMVGFPHRIITARKEKAWRRHFFHQIDPNWPLPHSTVPVPQMRDARPASWVTYCSICTSTMPWAQNRTGKDSILMWRRFTFPIFLIFIYGFLDDPCVLFNLSTSCMTLFLLGHSTVLGLTLCITALTSIRSS